MRSETYNKSIMRQVIRLSIDNVKNGGGPFAAAIVHDGKLITLGTNRVTLDNDPTAHAEISAIRNACIVLGTHDLSGCILYSSCEPCPMCLGAIYWSHISKVYYCNTKSDAKNVGFDDSFIYEEFSKEPNERAIGITRVYDKSAMSAFELWAQKKDKIAY